MAIAISIGIEALIQRIANKERALASNGFKAALGVRVKQLVREGYDNSRDPYGLNWVPLADGSGRAPLIKTGRLRSSYRTRTTTDEIIVGTAVPYAKYHQGKPGRVSTRAKRTAKGGRTSSAVPGAFRAYRGLPRRPGLPDSRGMPLRWRRELRKVIRQFT